MLRITLRTVQVITRNVASNITKLRNYFGATMLASIVHADICKPVINPKDEEMKRNLNFDEEIQKVATHGEKYLAQLMRVLRTLILQTSIEYQENLIKQIEITKDSTQIGPVGEHWDKLTGVRVKGTELKDELSKYEALASTIAEIVQLESTTALAIGSQMVMEQLSSELLKLQKLYNQQLVEINKYESELVSANRDSILHGIKAN